MIARIWKGFTKPANAYENLLRSEIFEGIHAKQIKGFRKINLLRKDSADETAFITIMWFDDLDAVKAFAGERYEQAVVPDHAKKLLSRFDAVSEHYEVLE